MSQIKVFRNCLVLRDHAIRKEDLWVQGGQIINPEPLFYDVRKKFDLEIDCRGALLAPGLIDLQINGGYGVDFTFDIRDQETAKECLGKVGKGLLSHGVTSFCPTLVSSLPDVYARVLPHLAPSPGGPHGAEVLGCHAEGPFISKEKNGAHNLNCIRDSFDGGFEDLRSTYGPGIRNVRIITLAPELDGDKGDGESVVRRCVKEGITVSLGHSMATLIQGECAVRRGARLVTHLFNAMASFHHRRDPGLLGLLASTKLDGCPMFYGIIADGIHTHPAALRVAYRTNFPSLCLVTDAISSLGLSDGRYHMGQNVIEVKGERAVIAGTDTLCGAIASLFKAVQKLMKGARCTLEEGLEAASLHPAQALGIEGRKGTLEFGTDADFVMLDARGEVELVSTWIAGECVYENREVMHWW